ncbi:MAG: GNAT family N-acetyltransferase, partial [Terriglobia bacterium]
SGPASMITIKTAEGIDEVRNLWQEYWAELGLPGDFQGFDTELRTLPGKYGAPLGVLGTAYVDGILAGTVALRPLIGEACEVKRLYVRPQFRRRGIGRALMEWIVGQARQCGYRKIHGDTLPTMTDAMRMYHEIGFRTLEHPYPQDPTPGAIYLELRR